MNIRTTLAGMTASLLLCTPALAHSYGDPGVALRWNETTLNTVPAAGPLTGRSAALVHLAQFEAVNSMQRRYRPYLGGVRASDGASPEAAAAQAAHDVLVALVPGQKDAYDAALANDLAPIPSGRAMQGVAVGQAAAKRVLDWAATDGFATPDTPFTLPLQAGAWRPAPGAAQFTRALNIRPMALESRTQFLPKRFPNLNSTAYTDSYNEVKDYGRATGSARTPAQSELAQLWATIITRTNQFQALNQVARQGIASRRLDLLDTTRALALMNVSLYDALVTTMSSKFVYGLWRPVTAIQNGDDDLNPNTIGEAGWTTFVPVPPYPSYPGNVACIGAVVARSLQNSLGSDAITFDIVWKGANPPAGSPPGTPPRPDVTQRYTSLWAVAVDAANARIYGGLHFRFDNEASQEICPKIADWIHARYMKPREDRRERDFD